MVHPQDWGKGPMQEITMADLVLKYDDEAPFNPEVLKDRGPGGKQFTSEHIRVVFIDLEGNRHIFVGTRARSPERKW